MHRGETSTDGKRRNGRQRDRKRVKEKERKREGKEERKKNKKKKKKSRPLVVKAPSLPFPSLAISLFRSFSLPLSHRFIQHSCLCTRLLCGGGSKTTRVALNSIMAAVHFFLLSHTFPRIVRRKKEREKERGRGKQKLKKHFFFQTRYFI